MKPINHLFLIAILVAGLLLHSCTHKAVLTGTPVERYATSQSAGFDPKKMAGVTKYIEDSSNTTGLVVLYDGKVLYEYGDIEKVTYIASCRKSVLSMLYGKHVDNGTIELDQTIGALGIDEKDGLLPKEKEATVDNIITCRSGVFHKASNAGYDKENALERGSVEPGEYFLYNNWDFNVAGEILEIYTGKSIYQEMDEQLAKTLGFQDWNLDKQKKTGKKSKSQYLAYHMDLSTRDMAKIAQLMLNEGEWNGVQLIPRDWVKKTTTTVTPAETLVERWGEPSPNDVQMSYGYMWWLVDNYRDNPIYEGAYTAIGYGGQYITVVPKMKLAIGHKTKLNLPTLMGITYKETSGQVYWNIIDKIVNARIENPQVNAN